MSSLLVLSGRRPSSSVSSCRARSVGTMSRARSMICSCVSAGSGTAMLFVMASPPVDVSDGETGYLRRSSASP